MSVVSADVEPLTFIFEDDGLVPNNPMPFLVYKGAVDVANDHPEKTIEGLFGANGWGAMWRNGVYDYAHYHATVHEALGVARGHARVQFGGDHGKALDLSAGDPIRRNGHFIEPASQHLPEEGKPSDVDVGFVTKVERGRQPIFDLGPRIAPRRRVAGDKQQGDDQQGEKASH